jgi:S1-C subfamily serine protease
VAVEARRDGETAPRRRRALLLRGAPAVLALGLGALGVVRGVPLTFSVPIAPLARLRDEILVAARQATWLGLGALVSAIVAVIVLRKSRRLFRSWPLFAAALLGLIGGVGSSLVGGLAWAGASTWLGWEHVEVPVPRSTFAGPAGDVVRATAVVVAPDEDGDGRGLAMGTGAIIRSDGSRAWIVTCSHVAMPYVSPSAPRDASRAHPVWVYLSDGRNDEGRVVWVARPPLDVAVVTVDLPDPPPAIPVRTTADAVERGDRVFFVPNPLRHGWQVHRGAVTRREPHDTPAGRFSLVFSDLPVLPGDSGSGLFLADGRLVGLNTWRKETPRAPVAIGLPSDALQEILSILEAADPERLLEEGSRR